MLAHYIDFPCYQRNKANQHLIEIFLCVIIILNFIIYSQ